jgi:hypothetical protein
MVKVKAQLDRPCKKVCLAQDHGISKGLEAEKWFKTYKETHAMSSYALQT